MDQLDMEALRRGDKSAFTRIVERWQKPLLNFLYRATGNSADAEDIAQEAFIEIYRAARRYRPSGSFQAFLFTIARRRLIDHYRHQSRRPLDYLDPSEYPMQSQASPEDGSRDIEEAFHQALAALPDNQRQAILLRQQQELSYEEIAVALNASVSAVKSWIHRARQHLRTALRDFDR
jgi:RNA polymerase sigma-70 factor (ECF subfamily)